MVDKNTDPSKSSTTASKPTKDVTPPAGSKDQKPTEQQPAKENATGKPVVEEVEDLSDEDRQLKEELLLCVERLKENDQKLYKPALEILRTRIKESTSSMTSVPKPLKFLRNQYETLKSAHEKINDKETKEFSADIISVLGMTISDKRECLKYRFLGSREAVGSWGHEYVRHLTAELTQEWNEIDAAANKEKEAATAATTTPAQTEDLELPPAPIIVLQ